MKKKDASRGSSLREWAGRLKSDTLALYLAARDPRVPWYVKALAVLVVGYALSPIDLIPDFIPVLGYLDDLLLVPLGLAVVVRLIPGEILDECRERARTELEGGTQVSKAGSAIVIGIWLLLAAFAAFIVVRLAAG